MTAVTDAVPNTSPAASIIVPSYRGAGRLPRLFDSFAAQAPETPAFEVIVVIDGVDDGSVALVDSETRFPVRAIVFPENRGRVAALNEGFAAARGNVLIRCDDDLKVPSAYVISHVNAHAKAFERGETIGAVGKTWDVHQAGRYASAYGSSAARTSYEFASTRPANERWRLWAANCSISRSAWEQIGPYSSAYTGYGWEDVDYGYRLHKAGIGIEIAEGATAEHHGPARSVDARARKAFDSGKARATFLAQHPDAPISAAQTPSGLWGLAVGTLANKMTHRSSVGATPSLVDHALSVVPKGIGTKLAALNVEAAGLAGERVGKVKGDRAPRIAIAHDYLTQRGGAERLVLSIVKAFPDATVHTLFYEPGQTYPEYQNVNIRVSPLNKISPFRKDPRIALPFLRYASDRMNIDADVVVASSSGWAHAFPTRGKKLVYCHSPARWLYLEDDYVGEAGKFGPKRLVLKMLGNGLRAWDKRAALAADEYVGNSSVVVERIKRVYGINADPLFPPFSPAVAEGGTKGIPALGDEWASGGHFLVVSRLQPYKHVDRVIDAFRDLPNERLLVIGKGPLGDQLRASAPENVRLVEGLSDAQMRWAYAHAKALVAASHEDFGLTPLEAGAHGVPVLALRAGGYLDTVKEGTNGYFFEKAQPADIREAVERLVADTSLDREAIREHADRFREELFIRQLRARVDRLLLPVR